MPLGAVDLDDQPQPPASAGRDRSCPKGSRNGALTSSARGSPALTTISSALSSTGVVRPHRARGFCGNCAISALVNFAARSARLTVSSSSDAREVDHGPQLGRDRDALSGLALDVATPVRLDPWMRVLRRRGDLERPPVPLDERAKRRRRIVREAAYGPHASHSGQESPLVRDVVVTPRDTRPCRADAGCLAGRAPWTCR